MVAACSAKRRFSSTRQHRKRCQELDTFRVGHDDKRLPALPKDVRRPALPPVGECLLYSRQSKDEIILDFKNSFGGGTEWAELSGEPPCEGEEAAHLLEEVEGRNGLPRAHMPYAGQLASEVDPQGQ